MGTLGFMLLAIAALICPSVMGSIGACDPEPLPFPLFGASMSMKGLVSFSKLLCEKERY
jgi:hypothetical protein